MLWLFLGIIILGIHNCTGMDTNNNPNFLTNPINSEDAALLFQHTSNYGAVSVHNYSSEAMRSILNDLIQSRWARGFLFFAGSTIVSTATGLGILFGNVPSPELAYTILGWTLFNATGVAITGGKTIRYILRD